MSTPVGHMQTCASASSHRFERDITSRCTLRWDDTVYSRIIPSRHDMVMAGLDMRDLWWTRAELKFFKRELLNLRQDAEPSATTLPGVATSTPFASTLRAFRLHQPTSRPPSPTPRLNPQRGKSPRQNQAARHAHREQLPCWRPMSPRTGPYALGSRVTLVGLPRFKGRIGHIESAASRRGWCLVRLADRSLHCLKLRHLPGSRIGRPVACAPFPWKLLPVWDDMEAAALRDVDDAPPDLTPIPDLNAPALLSARIWWTARGRKGAVWEPTSRSPPHF